jgi:phosphohistidine phosphatase
MAQTRTLYIGRHAKSSWDFPGRADIDRPLAERGVKNAYEMVHRMKERGDEPGMIISSPANRALHTAIIFARGLRIPFSRFLVNDDLYMSGEDIIMDIIYGVDNSVDSLMIFGHNPDFTYLANYFLNVPVNNIPTSGIVKLVFNAAGWEEINKNSLVNHLFDFPKKK